MGDDFLGSVIRAIHVHIYTRVENIHCEDKTVLILTLKSIRRSYNSVFSFEDVSVYIYACLFVCVRMCFLSVCERARERAHIYIYI